MKILILLLIIPSISFADECIDCVERKKQICASECSLVDSKNALRCQKDCNIQYCAHKCPENHEVYKNFLEASCEKCLDDQYNLCECPTGSERTQAICKISCSEKKCKQLCE